MSVNIGPQSRRAGLVLVIGLDVVGEVVSVELVEGIDSVVEFVDLVGAVVVVVVVSAAVVV